MPTTDPETQRLHDAAEKILADRMRAQGRPADDYTADEYLDAVAEATDGAGVEASGDLEDVLDELGVTTRTVTAADLDELQTVILNERGFGGIAKASLPKHERMDAMREAVRRIGKPGEKRRDLEKAQTARKQELAVLGAKAGVLNPGNVAAWMDRYDRDPAGTTADLAAQGVNVPGYTPPSPLRDPEYAKAAAPFISTRNGGPAVLPDEFGVRLHMEAEELLEKKGRRRADGQLEYTAKEYAAATQEALDARVKAETIRLLEDEGLIVHGKHRYEQADWSRAYDEAKASVERQLAGR